MGKPTGFLEYQRELPSDINPLERIKNWNEFHLHFPEEKLRTQGARCMDCGVPFCHTGDLISGMASGCPINNLIPEWNDLIYKGLWEQALERLHKTNNFPEFTGRVCPAPCEGSCTVGMYDDPPVTIKNIEVSIVEKGFANGWIKAQPPAVRSGKKVAVIGSGPAGLSAAAQLNKAGHLVTVFEKADKPGGLLMYGIPNMKLDKKDVVDRRVRILEEEGISFCCSTNVGVDYTVEKLKTEFDAVILATGSTVPRNLPIEGRELNGVHFAMDFLTANTKAILNGRETTISAQGKDVVIIGGGDTGTDCVATSLRHGCRSVTQIEIMPKSPDSRTADNPWPEWPKVHKIDYGQEEAAAIYGADPRVYLTTVTKFEGDAAGNLKAIHTVEVAWEKNENGQFVPKNVAGSEQIRETQLVLLAMGFLGPEQHLLEALGVERDPRSNAKTEYQKYATNVPGIFAAGDCRRGQSLVVWGFNEGRGAARECDHYLTGKSELP